MQRAKRWHQIEQLSRPARNGSSCVRLFEDRLNIASYFNYDSFSICNIRIYHVRHHDPIHTVILFLEIMWPAQRKRKQSVEYKTKELYGQRTWTISLTKLKPPGPMRDPANRYPVITCKCDCMDDTTLIGVLQK